MISLGEADRLTTLPSGDRLLYRDGNHSYYLLPPVDDKPAERLASVTTVLKAMGDPSGRKSDALCRWAADLAREGLDWFEERAKKGSTGTGVHKAMEIMAEGEVIELDRVPVEQSGYYQGVAAFWLDAMPSVIASEPMLASREYRLAGRPDLVATLDEPRSLWVSKWDKAKKEAIRFRQPFLPGTFLFDLKTGFVGEEAMMQMAGYELLLPSAELPAVDQKLVVKVSDNGTYEVIESVRRPEDFAQVLALYRMLGKPGRAVVEVPSELAA